MKKTIKRVILGIVIVLVLAVVLVFVFINPIAKSAVEGGASKALGVETSLASIKVSPLSGKVLMNELIVSNPEGFVSTSLVDAGKFDIQVAPGSLLSDTVVIRKFEIDGLEMHIEQKMPFSNVAKIMENIRKSGGSKEGSTDKPKSRGKKVKADLIVIKNVTAHFHLPSLTGEGKVIPVPVPDLELKNVSSEGKANVAGQLVSQLFPAILASAIKNGQGLIPADFLNDLDSQVADLTKSLGEGTAKMIEGMDTTIKDVKLDDTAGEAGKAVEDVGEEAGKALEGIGEGLFGGDKDKE